MRPTEISNGACVNKLYIIWNSNPKNAHSWDGIVCGWSVSKTDEKRVRRMISETSELRLCSAPSVWPEVKWEQTKHSRDWNRVMLTETDPCIRNLNLDVNCSDSKYIHFINAYNTIPINVIPGTGCQKSYSLMFRRC